MLDRLERRLFAPVDIASTVVFRAAFGAVLAWHFISDITSGRLALQYITPHYFFTYPGFSWVQPLPGQGMVVLYWVLAALSLLVALGLWYRWSATLLFVGFTYTFLIDQARYQNHLYLTCLLCCLLIVVPAHRAGSLDALRRTGLRSHVIPAWGLWAIRFQLAAVYFFGGIAKLDGDWLLRAQPMRIWFGQHPPGTIRLGFFSEPWVGFFFSWGGLLFDLLIVPLLLWRRTRIFAFATCLVFHVINSQIFSIGYFPWMMAAASTIFLSPSWPRRLGLVRPKVKPAVLDSADRRSRYRTVALVIAALYVSIQVLAPLRHWVIPGDVAWTEEGHRFAWRMKLRDKQGEIRLFWLHPGGSVSPLDPATVLTPYQQKKMRHDPRMVQKLVLAVADGLERKGQQNIDIRVRSRISLNGRPAQPIIDPAVNLAATRPRLGHADWIVPLRSRGSE